MVLAEPTTVIATVVLAQTNLLLKILHFVNDFMKFFNVLLGPSGSTACATIRRSDAIVVTEEALKEHGMSLQFFVDCSQPGDTIIFDTGVVEPQNTTVVKHQVAFDVANPDTPRVVLKCPIVGTVFDIQ